MQQYLMHGENENPAEANQRVNFRRYKIIEGGPEVKEAKGHLGIPDPALKDV